ncbi:unnamed protein product [Allacma fusca]|uniref:Uncharacterized protein n=1 Tax=Allacma fusca TaxID=39272 RepID=A0A8J2KXU6_9HEXA|nr:unnamed protein product [Allacma fusca]
MVFVKDGQRFRGLCQYRTPAGSNYIRIHALQIRGIMNLVEGMRNQLPPSAVEPVPFKLPPQEAAAGLSPSAPVQENLNSIMMM